MKLKINYLLILCLAIFAASCSDEETDVSTITALPGFTIDGLPSSIEVMEVDTTVVLNFTFTDDQIFDVSLDVSASTEGLEGNPTATEDVDFILNSHSLSVATLQKAGSFSVTILPDLITEGDESFFINVTSADPSGLPSASQIEVKIIDVISTDLYLTFDWGGFVDYPGNDQVPAGMYPICGNVDLDVYVLDAAGNDLGIYDAATGACPETIVVSNWADGEYFLASNMWENGYAGLMANAPFPITVSAFKQGVFDASFVPTDVWTSEDLDQANDGNADFKVVGKVVVSGDTYTVTDHDGSLVASGFKAPHKVANNK